MTPSTGVPIPTHSPPPPPSSLQRVDGGVAVRGGERHRGVGRQLLVQLRSRVLEEFPVPLSPGLRQPQLLWAGGASVPQRGDPGQEPRGA